MCTSPTFSGALTVFSYFVSQQARFHDFTNVFHSTCMTSQLQIMSSALWHRFRRNHKFSIVTSCDRPLNLSRKILSSKSLSLHRTFNLQYLLWKPVCQTFRPGCLKTKLAMIKQRPSSCALLLRLFQSPNLLPSLSVAVKYLFFLLPEILVFASEMT